MKVLLCRCSNGGVIPRNREAEILAGLRKGGVEVMESADLCAMAATRDDSLREVARDPDLRVIACQPRAVEWLFHMAGAPLAGKEGVVLDARSREASEILDELGVPEAPAVDPEPPVPSSRGASWFPTIDFSRCSHCDRCRDFCLFDVFGSSPGGEIYVKNPSNCKPNCPACARICPEGAIVFPQSGEPTVNGLQIPGKEMTPEEAVAEAEGIFGKGDLYAKLQGRSRRRRVSLLKQAYAERAACGCSGGGGGDVTFEPSPPPSARTPGQASCACGDSSAGKQQNR